MRTPADRVVARFTDDAEPSTEAKVVHWQFRNRTGTPIRYDEPVADWAKETVQKAVVEYLKTQTGSSGS